MATSRYMVSDAILTISYKRILPFHGGRLEGFQYRYNRFNRSLRPSFAGWPIIILFFNTPLQVVGIIGILYSGGAIIHVYIVL